MSSVITLAIKRDRRSIYIAASLIIGLLGVVEARSFNDPTTQLGVIGLGFSGVVLVIVATIWWFPYAANQSLHINLLSPGESEPRDLFYVRSGKRNEEKPIPGSPGRYLMPVYLTRETNFSNFPEAPDCLTVYFRYWGRWDERVHPRKEVAIYAGVAVYHFGSVTIVAAPYELIWIDGPNGYRGYPVFEIMFVLSDDTEKVMKLAFEANKILLSNDKQAIEKWADDYKQYYGQMPAQEIEPA